MPRYTNKLRVTLHPQVFYQRLGQITATLPRAYNILLYYLGCRCSEGLNLRFEDIRYDPDLGCLFIRVHRLKGSKQVPPNPLFFATGDPAKDSPHVKELSEYALQQRTGKLFPVGRTTGYHWVKRYMGFYPHYYRMNRMSYFLDHQYSALDIHNWFGINIRNIDYYIVEKQLTEMGKGLR